MIDQEQAFLRQKGLPNRAMCPSCRQTRRLALRGGRQLFKAMCDKCNKKITVSYETTKVKNPIFCKKDYNQYWEDVDPIIADPLPQGLIHDGPSLSQRISMIDSTLSKTASAN